MLSKTSRGLTKATKKVQIIKEKRGRGFSTGQVLQSLGSGTVKITLNSLKGLSFRQNDPSASIK